jgi:hypothetical protein
MKEPKTPIEFLEDRLRTGKYVQEIDDIQEMYDRYPDFVLWIVFLNLFYDESNRKLLFPFDKKGSREDP